MPIIYPVETMLPTIQECNCTTANDVILFAAKNGLVIYEYSEQVKFVIVLVAFGFAIGIVATLIFQRSLKYGRERARKRQQYRQPPE